MLCKAVNPLPMTVVGIVQHGQQKARLYGTPTANIAAHLNLPSGKGRLPYPLRVHDPGPTGSLPPADLGFGRRDQHARGGTGAAGRGLLEPDVLEA